MVDLEPLTEETIGVVVDVNVWRCPATDRNMVVDEGYCSSACEGKGCESWDKEKKSCELRGSNDGIE